jgi:sporulation protein YhbH
MKIERDQSRFKQIVRGKIRQNMRKYVTHGEMICRKGRDLVSIPIPQLDVPHFRYGKNGSGGVGQGEGQEGDQIAQGENNGTGPAGSEPGAHVLEVEVSLDELAAILGDELQLPRIEPKGNDRIEQIKGRYRSMRRVGPESLRHFKRTYMEALRRQISSNSYVPDRPRVVPIREDKRFRSWDPVNVPQANAVIFYLMDVSGSMTDDQKEIVRTAAFWLDAWLQSQYEGVQVQYIIHDAAAKQVDEHTFYHTRESGGTRISSAYKLAGELIAEQFPSSAWNIYVFQFSDGDNWGEDNERSMGLLREHILPHVNQFCYGQVESPYGSGEYIRALRSAFGDSHEKIVLTEIENKEGIYDALKVFLGKGV